MKTKNNVQICVFLDYHGDSEDEENDNNFKKVGSLMTVDENNQEINEKMTIILSIKL